LWTSGGLLVLQGTLSFAWAPARESLAEQYLALPSRTARERRERLRFGEHALDEMAADGARRRVFSGLGTVAATAVGIGITYREQFFNAHAWNLGVSDGILFTILGVQTVVSIFQLFSPSEDERLRHAYWQQMQLLEAEQQSMPTPEPATQPGAQTQPITPPLAPAQPSPHSL